MCREFLSEVAEVDNFSDEAKRNEIIKSFDRTKFKSLKVSQRNEAMKAFKLDFETFFYQFNWSAVPKLQQMVSKRETEFKDFVNNFYYPNHRPDFKFTMNGSEIVLPFSVVSMFDYLIFVVANESLFLSKSITLSSDTNFNPHLFHSLYVYSNIIKPVDFNDQQFKLLDIIFLRPHSEHESSVVEHRSTHFKVVDVDILSEIRITILTALGQPAPFIHGPVFAVLEFQDFQHV
jgi:hypothetical protein